MSKNNKTLNEYSGRRKVSFNVPQELVEKLDKSRGAINRSTWITSAVMEKLANIEKIK